MLETLRDRPGRPLDALTRQQLERRLGIDMSSVRVHTGDAASRGARLIGARAFALGRDIYFASGQYQPHTLDGRRLLAHELAHIAQAANGVGGRAAEQTVWRQSDGNAGPALDPVPLWCGGGIDDWARYFLLIEPTVWSDLVTCACFGAALVDVVSPDPWFEVMDCLCGLLGFAQTVYALGADGGCWDWSKVSALDAARAGVFLGAVVADCVSSPVGVTVGGALGLGGGAGAGSAGGPPGAVGGGIGGAAFGAWLGAALVDLAAIAAQNLAQQGTPLPEAQLTACHRTWLRMNERLGQP